MTKNFVSLSIMALLFAAFVFAKPNTDGKSKPAGKVLTFRMNKQSARLLCWAAVGSSISFYYDKYSIYSECILAEYHTAIPECCTDLNLCNQLGKPGDVLAYTGNRRLYRGGMPSWDLIKSEITNNRPIVISIHYRPAEDEESAYHVIVLHGFYDNGDVQLSDPWPGFDPGRISYNTLRDFYKDTGEVSGYYLTKPEFE